ncbi:hypothetical protein Salat_2598300 [Sesamum alatum]|uniref:Uncharacterized protein n=1 Tax=Sesamum alatum TaxID=300844 RepID=A0AAE1XP41_9LAMI|nr:hypothetical protein Salat_2598300 [Sesamum alatum]
MTEGTHVVELRKDVEGLKEQLCASSESAKKLIDELRSMIVAMVTHLNNSNLNVAARDNQTEQEVNRKHTVVITLGTLGIRSLQNVRRLSFQSLTTKISEVGCTGVNNSLKLTRCLRLQR